MSNLTPEEHEAAMDREHARWQDRIEDEIRRASIEPFDASGSDSGDALDWTADQVRHALGEARAIGYMDEGKNWARKLDEERKKNEALNGEHQDCGIAVVALTRALREARSVLVAIDSNRHDPQDERERAAVAELRRVIDLCSANLEQWGVG